VTDFARQTRLAGERSPVKDDARRDASSHAQITEVAASAPVDPHRRGAGVVVDEGREAGLIGNRRPKRYARRAEVYRKIGGSKSWLDLPGDRDPHCGDAAAVVRDDRAVCSGRKLADLLGEPGTIGRLDLVVKDLVRRVGDDAGDLCAADVNPDCQELCVPGRWGSPGTQRGLCGGRGGEADHRLVLVIG
jgi:hypothetical protein